MTIGDRIKRAAVPTEATTKDADEAGADEAGKGGAGSAAAGGKHTAVETEQFVRSANSSASKAQS